MNHEQNSILLKKYSELLNECINNRKASKWSLSKMSKQLNISKTSLWNLENKVSIDFLLLENYARIFSLELDLFWCKVSIYDR